MTEEKIKVGYRSCTLRKDVDEETVMSIFDNVIRVDFVNIGEGLCGDYNPDDPEDVNLLRFDTYVFNPECKEEVPESEGWEEVEDASYCTAMPAETNESILQRTLQVIYKEYRGKIASYEDYLNGSSVKKLGEQLSWISPDEFKEKEEASPEL